MATIVSATPTSPPPPPWGVVQFSFSNRDTDSDLILDCNGRRFVIYMSAENLSSSPQLEEKYRFFLQVAENFELDDYTVEDFYDWVGEPFLPIFRELGSASSAHQSTLQPFLFPETLQYNLCAVSGELVPVPQLDPHIRSLPQIFGVDLSDQDCSAWRSFLPTEVRICEDELSELSSKIPSKVILKDQTIAFLKLIHCGDKSRTIAELDKYRIISNATLDDSVQISRLIGLVRDENGWGFGLLLTYVRCNHRNLSCAVRMETPTFLRQKWISQIKLTVKQLHEAGIIWGDAKPDSILIDENNDAWIVDFGGGYTEGWITKAMAETYQGDLDTLQKIVAFIGASVVKSTSINVESSMPESPYSNESLRSHR